MIQELEGRTPLTFAIKPSDAVGRRYLTRTLKSGEVRFYIRMNNGRKVVVCCNPTPTPPNPAVSGFVSPAAAPAAHPTTPHNPTAVAGSAA